MTKDFAPIQKLGTKDLDKEEDPSYIVQNVPYVKTFLKKICFKRLLEESTSSEENYMSKDIFKILIKSLVQNFGQLMRDPL